MKNGICTLFLLLPFCAMAQIQYEPGYFIDHNGNKTTSLIRHVDWLNNPDEFNYKLTANGEVLSAGLAEVEEFGVSDVKFINATVRIDTSSHDIRNLSRNRHPEWKDLRVFLKVLVEGKANLYSYKSPEVERFFYAVDGSPIEQLVYKQFLVSPVDISSNLTYLQQLKNDVSCGCEISEASLRKIRYDRSALEKHFRAFNICHGGSASVPSARENVRFSVTPGVDFSNFKVDNDIGFEKEYAAGTAFRLGVMAEYVLSFNRGKWSIIAEPTYQSYKSGNDVQYHSIEIPLGLRHHFFLQETSMLFVNAFVVPDIPLQYELVWSQTLTYRGNHHSLSLAAGFGFRHRKFSIEGRKYFARSVIDDANRFFFVYDKISVILGYRIK